MKNSRRLGGELPSRKAPLLNVQDTIIADYCLAELANSVMCGTILDSEQLAEIQQWNTERFGPSLVSRTSVRDIVKNRMREGFSLRRARNYSRMSRYFTINSLGDWSELYGRNALVVTGFAFRHNRDAVEFKLTWSSLTSG